RRTAGAGEGAPIITPSTGATTTAVLAAYRGVDPNNPIDNAQTGFTQGGTSVTVPGPSASMVDEELVVLQGAAGSTSPGTWTPPPATYEEVQYTAQSARSSGLADYALGRMTGTN